MNTLIRVPTQYVSPSSPWQVFILASFSLQNLHAVPHDLAHVFKNNNHNIRCVMRKSNSLVEQLIINNTDHRIYNIWY